MNNFPEIIYIDEELRLNLFLRPVKRKILRYSEGEELALSLDSYNKINKHTEKQEFLNKLLKWNPNISAEVLVEEI